MKQTELPISKNIPNAETIKTLQDTESETITLDEFREMCRNEDEELGKLVNERRTQRHQAIRVTIDDL